MTVRDVGKGCGRCMTSVVPPARSHLFRVILASSGQDAQRRCCSRLYVCLIWAEVCSIESQVFPWAGLCNTTNAVSKKVVLNVHAWNHAGCSPERLQPAWVVCLGRRYFVVLHQLAVPQCVPHDKGTNSPLRLIYATLSYQCTPGLVSLAHAKWLQVCEPTKPLDGPDGTS
jgi:hypothetical protein